jgi:hypothetical protein
MADHAYNDANLSPREFLLAVACDPTVKLKHRIQAAAHLEQIYGDIIRQVTIHIGGFPEYDHNAEPCVDVNDCINRTTPCPWEQIMRSIQGVRFHSCKDQAERTIAQDHSPARLN